MLAHIPRYTISFDYFSESMDSRTPFSKLMGSMEPMLTDRATTVPEKLHFYLKLISSKYTIFFENSQN